MCVFGKKLIVDMVQFHLKEMECEYCGKMFVDDGDVIAIYRMHKSVHHKDKMTTEEKILEDFRKKMIKQKNDYEKLKEKAGDSDLVFNLKDRDACNSSQFSN